MIDRPDSPEETDLVTEERLRRAVRFRDAEVTTSPDALTRIHQRASDHPSRRPWQRPGLLAGAAAALAVLIGGLAYTLRDDDSGPDVATDATDEPASEPATDSQEPADGTDEPASPPTSSLLPSTTSTAPATTTLPPLPELTARERADQGLIIWPLDSRSFQDPSTVAYSYATQALRIADPVFETETGDDGTAVVTISQIGEDGQPFGEATRLELVALDAFNWVIVRAHSDEIELTSVQVSADGLAQVTGVGRSFEGAARVVSRSVCDPEGVRTPITVGGGPEFAEFTQIVAFVPCGDFPVVIEVATEVVLDNGVPFVSSIAHVEPEVRLTWSVMRVPSDDVLNVRAGPGVDNDIVTTLAPDATGLELTDGEPESVDGQLWREVVAPDGSTGWVNSGYLTAQSDLSPDVAESLALEALAYLAGEADESSLFGPQGVHVGGIGIFADAPTPFVRVERETLATDGDVDWNPFPDEAECGAECVVSTRDFLDVDTVLDRIQLPSATGVANDLSFDEQFLFGPNDQLALFEQLYSVTVEVPATNEGDLDWRRYHLWFDWSEGRPQVMAIWRWGWTP